MQSLFFLRQRKRIEEENRKKRQAPTMIVANTDGRPNSGRKGKDSESRPILNRESKNSPSPVSYGKLKVESHSR